MNPKVREKLYEMAENNRYIQMLHMEILEMEEGHIKGRMKVEEDLINTHHSVHGGALYSFADVMTGFAACSYGMDVTTISGQMEFIRPAMNTKYVYCDATCSRHGNKISFFKAVLTDDEGQLLQDGLFQFYTLKYPIVED